MNIQTYSVEAFLKANTGDFEKGFKNASKQVDGLENSTANASISIGKLVATIAGVAAAVGIFRILRDSVGQAFDRIDTMEQFERVMTTMTGSSKKANDVLAKTNDIVTGTSYGLDIGAKAVQNFVTSNMDVDKATDTVAAWGDAVAFYGDGSNETFASVSDALSKMTAKGKVQMDSMNRLTEAGIPAMQIYADATGKSVEDVADQMQKGSLDAGEFTDVMNKALSDGTKNFAGIDGAAKEAGASWNGSFANMKAAVARGVTNIIDDIDKMLTSNGLPDMRTMVANFGKKFEEILTKAGETIPPLVESIKDIYDTLKPWIPLMSAVAIGVGSVILGITAFNTVKGYILSVKAAFLALNGTIWANPITWLVAAIIGAAILVYVYWEPISKFFIDLWGKIKVAGIAIWDALKDAWSATSDFLVELWEKAVELVTGVWDSIVSKAETIWSSITEAIDTAVTETKDAIVETWETVSEWVSTTWDKIVDKAKEVWDAIRNYVIFIGAAIVGLFIPKMVMMAIQAAISAGAVIVSWVQMAASAVVNAVIIAAQWTAMVAKAIWAGIVHVVTVVPQIVAGWLRMAVQAVIQGAIIAAQWVAMVAKAIWAGIVYTVQVVPQIIAAFARMALQAIVQTAIIIGQWIAMAASAVANVAIQVAQLIVMGAKWVWLGIQSLLAAAKVAAAWLIAMGPVAIVIAIVTGLVALIIANWDNVKKITQKVWKAIVSFFTSAWNNIKSMFSSAVNFVKNIISAGFNAVKSVITSILNGIRSIISSVWNGIKNTISTVINGIKNTISNIFNSLKGIVSGAFGKVTSAVKTGIGNAYDAVTGKISDFFNAGKNIIGSIADGIKENVKKVTGAISNVTQKIRDFLPFSPAKEGALRDIMKIQIPQSIAESIDKGKRTAVQAMSGLTDAINGEMPQVDIAGQVARSNARVNTSVSHEMNNSNARMENLLNKIANSNQVIVLDSGELVGATYNKYDRTGGNKTALTERWGR